MPDIENSRKTAEKGAEWVTVKQPKNSWKNSRNTRKTAETLSKQLFREWCFFLFFCGAVWRFCGVFAVFSWRFRAVFVTFSSCFCGVFCVFVFSRCFRGVFELFSSRSRVVFVVFLCFSWYDLFGLFLKLINIY